MPRRLDPQPRLRTGGWIPNRGYIQVIGFPTAATHGCLDPQPGLHTGVCLLQSKLAKHDDQVLTWKAANFQLPNVSRGCLWQLAQKPLGATETPPGLHTGVWVYAGVWIPSWGYTQVLEYARAFGSPTGATYRRLDPQTASTYRCFGFPAATTHGCLDPQPGLHTGVWSPKQAIV